MLGCDAGCPWGSPDTSKVTWGACSRSRLEPYPHLSSWWANPLASEPLSILTRVGVRGHPAKSTWPLAACLSRAPRKGGPGRGAECWQVKVSLGVGRPTSALTLELSDSAISFLGGEALNENLEGRITVKESANREPHPCHPSSLRKP